MTGTTILLLLVIALVGLVVYLAHAGKLAALEAKAQADLTNIWNAISDHDSVISAHDDAITDLSATPADAPPVASQTASGANASTGTQAADTSQQTDAVSAQVAGSSVQQ